MKNQITLRDYELISAYLDNQLSGKERAFLKHVSKRILIYAENSRRSVKRAYWFDSLPKLRAPRNYFVKAEAVQPRPTFRLAPVFGIVSAVSSVLLALVIFGSTFFESNPQVAMAPSLPVADETIAVQQEVELSAASPISPTEAAPVVMMGAPLVASPTPNIGALKAGPTEHATPTTVYLYAYPPTSTPENLTTLNEVQAETDRLHCEEIYGSSAYPTLSSQYNCPTPSPSSTSSEYSLSIQSSTSITPTITSTPTATLTPTTTPTPTPTNTPTPTASPTPTPTIEPPSFQNIAPTVEVEIVHRDYIFRPGVGDRQSDSPWAGRGCEPQNQPEYVIPKLPRAHN